MTNNKIKYEKPPLTVEKQIELLKSRGLVIDSDEKLKYFLTNVSYYHWSIYFKHFQNNDVFREGTNFEDILKIYVFDNKLRLLLLEILERIEKSFKCRFAYELSLETDNSHCYLKESLFDDRKEFEEVLKILTEEVEKSKEISIKHYKETYDDPALPPIWTVIEILSFGQCVKISSKLKRFYRNKIAKTYGEDEKFILSWMHCLSNLRNTCAHHSWLWNRRLTFIPAQNHKVFGKYFNGTNNNRLFNYLVVMQIVLSKINPTTSWLEKFKSYVNESEIEIYYMGFPSDWEERLNKIMNDK
jgi:abortive infection bacteriophage resistance protein